MENFGEMLERTKHIGEMKDGKLICKKDCPNANHNKKEDLWVVHGKETHSIKDRYDCETCKKADREYEEVVRSGELAEMLNEQLEKEICICAAIKMKDDYIIRGHRHSDCIRTAEQIPRYKKDGRPFGENQGFVTSRNRYVDRIEGAKLQKAAGIESKMPEGQESFHGELYSEDLY